MNKSNKIIYWVATIWLALGMLSTGIVQLLKADQGQGGAAMIKHLGYPIYLLGFIGACKIAGVIAILIPKAKVLKEWVYAGFVFLTTGAAYSHIAAGDQMKDVLPSILLLVLTLVSWRFRPSARKIIPYSQPQTA